MPDPLEQLTKRVSSLQPAAYAELHAQIGAVGDPKGPLIVLEAVDQARDPTQSGRWRIIGMESQADVRRLSNWDDPLHKVGKARPDLVLSVCPSVRVGPPHHLTQVDPPCPRAADLAWFRTPNVGWLPSERRPVYACPSQIMNELRKLRDHLISALEGQMDLV